MKIKFEENLDYQLEAINSITDIFLGQEANKARKTRRTIKIRSCRK